MWKPLSAVLVVAVLAGCSDVSGPTQDQDPDPDNDGFSGVQDQCPTAPETLNGVFDGDGCPDTPRDLYVAVREDVEAFWGGYFPSAFAIPYRPINGLVFFSGSVNSACGVASGPFYCGLDFRVYVDEPFMLDQLNRIGDFAPAIIIAHEIGHHTQALLGLLTQPSIQKELQADCLAGRWAGTAGARGLLDYGDIQEKCDFCMVVYSFVEEDKDTL